MGSLVPSLRGPLASKQADETSTQLVSRKAESSSSRVAQGKGSLIRNVNLASSTPLFVIPESDIQEATSIPLSTSATTVLFWGNLGKHLVDMSSI